MNGVKLILDISGIKFNFVLFCFVLFLKNAPVSLILHVRFLGKKLSWVSRFPTLVLIPDTNHCIAMEFVIGIPGTAGLRRSFQLTLVMMCFIAYHCQILSTRHPKGGKILKIGWRLRFGTIRLFSFSMVNRVHQSLICGLWMPLLAVLKLCILGLTDYSIEPLDLYGEIGVRSIFG